MLSSHLFFCLPCLLPPFAAPYRMVLARLNERETRQHHFSLRLFTIVRTVVFVWSYCLQNLGLGSGQLLWTCTGRNKTLAPSTSLPVLDEIAGVNTASLGRCLHSSKTRARWAEGFHDEHNGHVFDLERDELRQVVFCP